MTITTARMRGWTITHTAGERLAEIWDPYGNLDILVEPAGIKWKWAASLPTREATREDLADTLLDYLDGDEG